MEPRPEERPPLDTVAEAALRLALKGQLSAEVRRRIEQLLANLEGKTASGEWVRGLRALEVLEYIGTREARQVLQDLVRGASGARLTREAKAALERLAKRYPATF